MCCSVLFTGSSVVGPDVDIKFSHGDDKIVSYDTHKDSRSVFFFHKTISPAVSVLHNFHSVVSG